MTGSDGAQPREGAGSVVPTGANIREIAHRAFLRPKTAPFRNCEPAKGNPKENRLGGSGETNCGRNRVNLRVLISNLKQGQCCTPVILCLRNLRQENRREFKATGGSVLWSSLSGNNLVVCNNGFTDVYTFTVYNSLPRNSS